MDWNCDHCGFLNNCTSSRCHVCNIKRIFKSTLSNTSNEEEISCPVCTLLNSINSTYCEACNHMFEKGCDKFTLYSLN